MRTLHETHVMKWEGKFMRKRLMIVAVLAVALVALAAAPALAEGYNNGQYNFNTDADSGVYGENAGIYVRTPYAGSDQIATAKGPHGDYTTTTNKCQDCHSTHYATGSYMLLRANSQEAACDFCHTGGGGSELNVMMDNNYVTQVAYDAGAAAAEKTTSDANAGVADMGYGTGHSLGYAGKAPADIDPAYENADGLACFSCHSPHGNSERIMGTFGSPSAKAGNGDLLDGEYTKVYYCMPQISQLDMFATLWWGTTAPWGMTNGQYEAMLENAVDGMMDAFGDPSPRPNYTFPHPAAGMLLTPARLASGITDGEKAAFTSYLLSNPMFVTQEAASGANNIDDVNMMYSGEGKSLTTTMGPSLGFVSMPSDMAFTFTKWNIFSFGIDADEGNVTNKFDFGPFDLFGLFGLGDGNSFKNSTAVGPFGSTETWKKPLWPAGKFLLLKNPDNEHGLGVAGDLIYAAENQVAGVDTVAGNTIPNKAQTNWNAPIGPAASWGDFYYTETNEKFPIPFPFAPAGIAMENEFCADCHDGAAGESDQVARVWLPQDNAQDGIYLNASSHDSNTRGCARQQYLNPDDDNNFGPHCANCHTGAGSCNSCHAVGATGWEGHSAYYASPDLLTEWESAYLYKGKTRSSAVVGLNGQCVDGGFSFPHRTLGANMLKDTIYGVDFDGTPIGVGETRGVNAPAAAVVASWTAGFGEAERYSAAGQTLAVENLDSVCIDCHGDAKTWNGDNEAQYYTSHYVPNPLAITGLLDPRIEDGWNVVGWELVLKGLP